MLQDVSHQDSRESLLPVRSIQCLNVDVLHGSKCRSNRCRMRIKFDSLQFSIWICIMDIHKIHATGTTCYQHRKIRVGIVEISQ